MMRIKKLPNKFESGQAYFEALACLTVVFAFLVGAQYLWRSAELAQMAVDSVRFAAWERTVWEPEDNDIEIYALHKTDIQLGKDVVMRQLSMPAAWRKFRVNLSSSGTPQDVSSTERSKLLHPSAQKFVRNENDPLNMVKITTNSHGKGELVGLLGRLADATNGDWWKESVPEDLHELRGGDPTFGKVTTLQLDKKTWRTTVMELKTDYKLSTLVGTYLWKPDPGLITKQLSLITNSWAASPPVSFVRDRQLMPFSTGDRVSGFKGNEIGNYMKHPWAVLGGSNGYGGQYLSRQIGVNATQVTDMLYQAGQNFDTDMGNVILDNVLSISEGALNSALPGFDIDIFNPVATSGFMAQTQQSEFFNPNAVSQWHHKHTFVVAEDADFKGEPGQKAANSNIGKRKYRAISARNPVDTYFTR